MKVSRTVGSATNLAEWGPGADEFQDDGVGILLDAMGYIAVHHDFVELVASRPDIIHQDLVRSEFVLDRSVTVINFLQFHPVPQLVDHLNPEPRLKQSDKVRLVLCRKNVSIITNLGEASKKRIHVYVYDLYRDIVNSSDYVALNDRMNTEYKIEEI
jgi:hypothetical protein